MIDYKKLKIAHELCDKYAKECRVAHFVGVLQYVYDKPPNYCLNRYDGAFEEQYSDIDDLITHLKELKKPKYEVGQEVFFTCYEDISSGIIELINLDHGDFKFHIAMEHGYINLSEDKIYSKKSDLIEAQLRHWTSLKVDLVSESSMCEQCGMQRMHNGQCWHESCNYFGKNREPSQCNQSKSEHINDAAHYFKGFNKE